MCAHVRSFVHRTARNLSISSSMPSDLFTRTKIDTSPRYRATIYINAANISRSLSRNARLTFASCRRYYLTRCLEVSASQLIYLTRPGRRKKRGGARREEAKKKRNAHRIARTCVSSLRSPLVSRLPSKEKRNRRALFSFHEIFESQKKKKEEYHHRGLAGRNYVTQAVFIYRK